MPTIDHIHVHLHRKTRDAGTAHDPKSGQFTSGTHVKINAPGIKGHGESGHVINDPKKHPGGMHFVSSPSTEYHNYGPFHGHQLRATGKAPAKGSEADKIANPRKLMSEQEKRHAAVENAIGQSERRGGKVSGRERSSIHALLGTRR